MFAQQKNFHESSLAVHIGSLVVVGFFCQLFGRKCQNLLFMLLPGTVAQNVWFNLTSPPGLAERKSEQPKLKSKVFLSNITRRADKM